MWFLRLTPQVTSRIQFQRRMSAFVIFFILLFLPGSCSMTPWISCDKKLPGGSGFLVSENYPLKYPGDLSCVYTIPLQPNTHDTSAICLRFQRFQMQKTRDYLQIHGQPWMQNSSVIWRYHEYTGLGENKNPSDPAVFSNVWEDSFCWIPNGGEAYLKLVFYSENSAGDLGFFASYNTVTLEQIKSDSNIQRLLPVDAVATAEVGLARSCGVVCFDRSCSRGEACPSSAAGGCADRSDRSYAHSRCKTSFNTPVQVPGQMACDFDIAGCLSLWIGGRMWQRTSRNHDSVYGPKLGRGWYMVKDFSDNMASWLGDITVAVPTSMEGKHQCLSFWYHMNGPDVGQLQVYWQDRLRAKGALWNREGSYGNYWHHTHISLFIHEGSKNNNISFSANKGSEDRAQFAIDDLSLMEGLCPYYDDISCTFNDKHLCGWIANNQPSLLAGIGRNVVLHYKCPASCGGVANTSRAVVLTSPPVAIGGHTCLILHYRIKYTHGKLVVRRSHLVMKEQWSKVDNTGWRLAKYTISPAVGNASISSRIKIESYMSSGGVFDMEEITFVPISCEQISLGSCKKGEFRCRGTGTCVRKTKQCNQRMDCSMEDDSDEANCQFTTTVKPNISSGSYNGVALIALIAGCILIVLIILVKITLCLHVRYKRRRLLQLRDRRLEALRSIGRCNSIDSIRPDLMPPSYADCIHDNPGFVLGEESEDKRNLPSYSQVIEGGYLMITNPVKSELQRLRMEMQERPAEEATSTAEQQDHQVEFATIVAGQNTAMETHVTETGSGSGYQDYLPRTCQGQFTESNHQRLHIDIGNETPYGESSGHASPLDPCHQEPSIEPAVYVPAVEQDQRLTLQQLHQRPSQASAEPIQLPHNADGTDRNIATVVQCVENDLLPQRQPVNTEVQPLSLDHQVQTQPSSHHQFIDTMEEPGLASQTPVCTEVHVSDNSVPPVQVSGSSDNASSLQIIENAPIYMLPHDSCPSHLSLAIWDDSEVHV